MLKVFKITKVMSIKILSNDAIFKKKIIFTYIKVLLRTLPSSGIKNYTRIKNHTPVELRTTLKRATF